MTTPESENTMLTLHDYLPSQNAWKVRQLLAQLDISYRPQFVAIFDGEGQADAFLAKNPAGAVPVLELESGECLAESDAILCYLADGTRFLPEDRWLRAQVMRWLCFEADNVQSSIATLRHWTLTGKTALRDPALVEGKRYASLKVLGMLERHLRACADADSGFLVGDGYTIADIAVFAYVHLAEDAGLALADFPALAAWIARVQAQPAHLAQVYPYSIDVHSGRELT
jgi:glutathione S-transferase